MKYIFVLIVIFFSAELLHSQGLSPDSTFGKFGKTLTTNADYNGLAQSMLLQPDGKIVVGGYATLEGEAGSWFAVYRYNTNGTPDSSFGDKGIAITQFNQYDQGMAVALQADNKILIAGSANKNQTAALVRYQTNGVVDSSFGNNGMVTLAITGGIANCIAIQNDGKILAGGYSYNFSSSYTDFALERCKPDGSADSTFGQNGVATTHFEGPSAIQSLAIQPDNNIVVTGYANNGLTSHWAFARYTATGVADSSFAATGVITSITGSGRSVAVQSDGKILCSGGDGSNFELLRFNSDGSTDELFGNAGQVITFSTIEAGTQVICNSVIAQPNGAIIATGNAQGKNDQDIVVARYNNSGVLQDTILTDFFGPDFGRAAVVQPDGKIIAAGYNNAGNYSSVVLTRYNATALPLAVVNVPAPAVSCIYPNPVGQQATLQYTLAEDETLSAGLYDVNGKLVQPLFANRLVTKGEHTVQLQFNGNLPTGYYLLVIGNGQQTTTIRVAKN